MKYFYVCLTYCYVIPLAIAVLARRLAGQTYDVERIGISLPKIASGSAPVWLVASSVGEVTIALKLIERFKTVSNAPIILSVTTTAGRARAIQAPVRADLVFFHPFDISIVVRRALSHFQPKLIILVETELWPILMENAFETGVLVAQVSGRISEKSHRRYRALRPFFGPLIGRCSLLLMQSEEDAARIRDIAGVAAPVEIIGSIKEDYSPPAEPLMSELKAALSGWQEKIVFTCGSTRPTEEPILCDAFLRLHERRTDLRMIIAPRHLERTGEIEEVLRTRSISFQRWTQGNLRSDTQALVLDTIGKLNAAYHFSQLAFVGGTIAPLGGHNLLEPALAGCPVLHGPHVFQQMRPLKLLEDNEMGILVTDARSIEESVTAILSEPGLRQMFQNRAERLRRSSSHVLDEYIDRIMMLISHD
jgi:3-deoxy-D-manno-octulosonic-acid transferase